jgi:hypothetical protein
MEESLDVLTGVRIGKVEGEVRCGWTAQLVLLALNATLNADELVS